MTKIIADITMSLDGYVTAPGADLEHGLGVGGEPLHDWAIESDDPVEEHRDVAGGDHLQTAWPASRTSRSRATARADEATAEKAMTTTPSRTSWRTRRAGCPDSSPENVMLMGSTPR